MSWFRAEQIKYRHKKDILRGRDSHSHCLNICRQTSQPDVQPVSHGEDLLEVCRDHLGLNAKPPVCCDRHAVLPPHGHDSPAIIWHNRLEEDGGQKWINHLINQIYKRVTSPQMTGVIRFAWRFFGPKFGWTWISEKLLKIKVSYFHCLLLP